MKKRFAFLLCAVLMFCFTACGAPGSNSIFDEASPDTSVLTMYVYENAGGGVSGWISDLDAERDILEKLSAVKAVPAENWSPADVTFPVFALEIGSADGLGVHVVWSNGYLIERNGSAYRFDHDFEKLRENNFEDVSWNDVSLLHIPCARCLMEGENGWQSALMVSAPPASPQKGITMELVSWTEEAVEVKLTNDSGNEWIFGESFALDVQLDGVWYRVPPTAEMNWGFTSMANVLLPGETRNESYSLMMYGDLPEGQYRLVVEDLSVKNSGWNSSTLIPCEELIPREDVSFEYACLTDNVVEMVFKNNESTDILYDGWPVLQVKLDGSWYRVPYRSDVDVSHTAELGCIMAGKTVTEKLYVSPDGVYGILPTGNYRAVMFGYSFEFAIP